MITIDALGLSCPLPIVTTMASMAAHPGEEIVIHVDNEAAKENVIRLAQTKGYMADIVRDQLTYRLTLRPAVGAQA